MVMADQQMGMAKMKMNGSLCCSSVRDFRVRLMDDCLRWVWNGMQDMDVQVLPSAKPLEL